MTSDTIELVERVRRRLQVSADGSADGAPTCQIAGPVPEAAISAAEEALGVTFPPSYRTFLRTFGGIAIPSHLGVVHDFVGVAPNREGHPPAPSATTDDGGDDNDSAGSTNGNGHHVDPGPPDDCVGRTLIARAERKLADHLVVVGMGAEYQEWFCLDVSRPDPSGEYPVLLFDARDNALDQQFYDDFGQMLQEVMGFVADSLDQPLD